MIDLDDNRLSVARRFGATHTFNSSREDVVRLVRDLTDSKGVDAAIEAVGVPATFGLCEELVAPGGVIANVGVHGTKVDLHLAQLWSRNVTITTRLVDSVSTQLLLQTVEAKRCHPVKLVTPLLSLHVINKEK